MKPIYSVVIPVFNLRRTIELLLRCLERQTLPRDHFECIIVDDGSTDGTSNLLREYRPTFNLSRHFHVTNLGRSQARNTGWQQAKGDIVVFLDADTLPAPAWLEDYDKTFIRNPCEVISGGRHSLDVSAGKELLIERVARAAGTTVEDLFVNNVSQQFAAIHKRSKLGPYPNLLSERLEVQLREVCRAHPASLISAYSFITSNVAVRMDALCKTTGFSSFVRRGEDTELGLRLWEMGVRFGFADGAFAYHLYDSRQADRGINLTERLAFFYRHPYHLNLMIAFWSAYNSPASPPAPLAIFSTLQSLAEASDELRKMDLAAEFYRLYHRPLPADCRYNKQAMIDYFAEISGIPSVEIEKYLNLAIAQGLVVLEQDNEVYFDLYHTANWLRRATSYQEYVLRHASFIRSEKTPFQRSKNTSDLLSVSCRGKYEIGIPLQPQGSDTTTAVLSIPLPVESDYQTRVKIGRTRPEKLLDYYDPESGMIREMPLDAATENGEVRVEYEFCCTVHEITSLILTTPPLQQPDLAVYQRPTLSPQYRKKAEELLKRILPDAVFDPYASAKMIYRWISDNTIYLQTPFPEFLIFDTGFGACVHQAAMFINLCRLLRIPARKRSCALFSKVERREPPMMEDRTRGYPPFSHTWAEFYVPARGWIPVEFLGCGFGKRVLSPMNVVDDQLRIEITNDTALYDEYYFGSIDPYRIHVSDWASKLPFLAMQGVASQDPALQGLLAQTRHRLTCEFAMSH